MDFLPAVLRVFDDCLLSLAIAYEGGIIGP